jgi:hypothetical protein
MRNALPRDKELFRVACHANVTHPPFERRALLPVFCRNRIMLAHHSNQAPECRTVTVFVPATQPLPQPVPIRHSFPQRPRRVPPGRYLMRVRHHRKSASAAGRRSVQFVTGS